MSRFDTATPQVTAEPETEIVLPRWARSMQVITMSLLPCCLISLYWMKKIKCERVISVSVWAYIFGVAVTLAWLLANYRTKQK